MEDVSFTWDFILLLSNIFSWIYLPPRRKKIYMFISRKKQLYIFFHNFFIFLSALSPSPSSNVQSFLFSLLPIIQYPDIHLITHIHILLGRFCTCGEYMPSLNSIHSKPIHFPEILVIPFFFRAKFLLSVHPVGGQLD